MTSGLQLRTLIKKSGELELSLVKAEVPEPGPDQVVVKIQATPINPSDLGLLLGPADMSAATTSGSGEGAVVKAKVSQAALPFLARGSTSRCPWVTRAPARWSRRARRKPPRP